ncbi:hypothetical protein HYW17_02845 [Candidatus Uhrbacteria bacterium]|nr:hypothetical protein [Candidatus Uhrbacteria bacterium]
MDLAKTLEGIGFREVEAEVYLATLELGEAIASDIAKKSRLKRPSVYVILKDLIKHGYVSSYSRRGITRFVARDPKLVVSAALEKAQNASAALPEFLSFLKITEVAKPRIQYFDELPGIIAVMEDTIVTGNKTVLVWADIELSWNTLREYYPEYIRKKNERGVFVEGIFLDNAVGRMFKERGKIEKREVRLVPADKFPMSNEINIYDDKVAIISHKDLMGVIIQNQQIADTQRSVFKLGWEAAGEYAGNVE